MSAMIQALLPILASIGGTVAKNLFPDPGQELEREKVKNEVAIAVMQQAQAIEQAAADIVKTEAASQHWLAANWRPLTMLVFVALIVARWFGWSAPGLSEAEALALWDIVQIGLGGYVVGRTCEKLVPSIAEAMKKR
jgi:hypothetical protein